MKAESLGGRMGACAAAGSPPSMNASLNLTTTDKHGPVRRNIQVFLRIAGAVAAAVGLTYGAFALQAPPGRRFGLAAACLLLAAGLVLAGRCMRRADDPRRVLVVAGWAAIGVVALTAFVLGDGTRTPALGFSGIVICVVSLIAGLRTALLMGATTGAAIVALAALEAGGGLVEAPAPAGGLAAVPAATQLLILGLSIAAGALINDIARYLGRETQAREQRLRRVLQLAAEWYWETDAEFRFTHVTEASHDGSGIAARTGLGRAPWEIEGYGLDPVEMDEHRADLETRRPFRGVLLRQRDAEGRERWARISGEPRLDGRGVFLGYCGVGRDVTDEIAAQRAALAVETRYQELFQRSPVPLLLHRAGRVVEANGAALGLLGHASFEALAGSELTRHHDDPAVVRRLQRRIDELEAAAVGVSNRPEAFDLLTADGRRRKVVIHSVRVDAAGGPATLTIIRDETERLLADAALRRSEALLSHVVATSPDAIALTDFHTGRIEMINTSFAAMSGYAADEVVGQTAQALGLWHRPADREAVRAGIRGEGRIDGLPVLIRDRGGRARQTLMSAATFRLGGRSYVVSTSRDVTQAERLRREYEAMLTYAAIGIAFMRDHRYVQVNRGWERMFGWAQGSLVGREGACVWPDARGYEELAATVAPLLAAGRPFEGERLMCRRDGGTFLCHVRVQAIDPDDPSEGGTIWIAEDVTERRRMEQALASARDAAEAASRAKSAFLANTSHELRTPLNGMLGLARLAQDPDTAEERRRHYLQQIIDSAGGLAAVFSDILDLSEIEAGRLALEPVPFDLQALLDGVRRQAAEQARARRLRFAMQVDPALPAVAVGDPFRVRQILGHFVANALKFTEHGRVEIDVRPLTEGRVRFTVADTGVGIDAAVLARLFRPFTQADDSPTRRYGGTGLGLAICRELATLMGGTVGASSETARGSRFWAELPLLERDPAIAPVEACRHAPLPPVAAPAARPVPGVARRRPVPAREPLEGARVLLVEDNAVNMMIGVAMLEQWGIDVSQALDGRCAIEAVHAAEAAGRPFHAVLMDVQMPVMGGHEAATVLRRERDARSLPIIALTAAALVEERQQALDAGMNDFLTKPIDPEQLRAALQRALDGSFSTTV